MQQKLILLRDHSKESEKAEEILQEHRIDHAQLFLKTTVERLPCLLGPDVAYKGLGSIKSFVQSKK